MIWSLVIVAATVLPLQFPYENSAAIPPHTVNVQIMSGFESQKTCEYAAKWFRDNLRRQTKCFHS